MISLRVFAAATVALTAIGSPAAAPVIHNAATEGTVLSLLVQPDSARVDVVVGKGAIVDGCVVLPGVRIGTGAIVRRAILDKDVVVDGGAQIGQDPDADAKSYTTSPCGITVSVRWCGIPWCATSRPQTIVIQLSCPSGTSPATIQSKTRSGRGAQSLME